MDQQITYFLINHRSVLTVTKATTLYYVSLGMACDRWLRKGAATWYGSSHLRDCNYVLQIVTATLAPKTYFNVVVITICNVLPYLYIKYSQHSEDRNVYNLFIRIIQLVYVFSTISVDNSHRVKLWLLEFKIACVRFLIVLIILRTVISIRS